MLHAIASFVEHHPGIAFGIAIAAYLLLHHRSYRKRRRHGLSIWMSLPGPFGTRVSKRL
jgi:hypothetical protein